jgi:MOSC domain-containing protein YiiM
MKIRSVNVARARPLGLADGREVASAIGKQPATGRVRLGRLGLEGDEQADPSVHGGLTKALYAYGFGHMPLWRTLRAQALRTPLVDAADLAPGAWGENLSLDGLDEAQVWVGDRLLLPDAVLVVTEPRLPCFKFDLHMGFRHASKMMVQSGACGFYLAVEREGSIGAGDAVTLAPGPRELSIAELFALRTRKDRQAALFDDGRG